MWVISGLLAAIWLELWYILKILIAIHAQRDPEERDDE